MKKTLLLLFALLALSGGRAWAESVTITVANAEGAWLDGAYYGTAGTAWNTYWTRNQWVPLAGETVPQLSVTGTAERYMTNAGVIATTTFTIKVEDGTLSGYSISFVSNTDGTASTLTAADGTTASTSSGSEAATLNVTGLTSNTATFTVSGAYAKTTAFTVTYTPAEAATTGLYRIKSTWQSWLYSTTASADDLNKKMSSETVSNHDLLSSTNYIWNVKKQQGKVVALQNVATSRYAAAPTATFQASSETKVMSATAETGAESFTIVSRSSAIAGAVALQSVSSSTVFLNVYSSGNNYVGWHNSAHEGDRLLFTPLKQVTFTEAVAVDDGDAVSTLYVATDGSDSFTLPNTKLYSINGADPVGNADAAAAITAAGTSDITVTVSDNTSKTVTYNLVWNGSTIQTVENVDVNLSTPASEFVPASFVNACTTLRYSPEAIDTETTAVTVTAEWNGPFLLSESYADAKWYTVGIHGSYESDNHIWSYDSSTGNVMPVGAYTETGVATDDYASIDDNKLFAFVGDPYTGFTIYNKAAGDTYKLYRSGDRAQITMSSDNGTSFIPKASRTATVANGYFCLQPTGSAYYINWDVNGSTLSGWNDNDQGSTCWVIAPSQYPYNFLNGLVLDAPHKAVGTKDVDESTYVNAASSKTYFAEYPFYYAVATNRSIVNSLLNALKDAETITLTDGYYRIVNAYAGWSTAPAIYYNSENNRIDWSVASNANNNVNSIFKLTASTPSIYSPNAAKFMSAISGGTLADEAATTAFNAQGSAKYKVVVNSQTLHPAGHGSGANASGTLTSWDYNDPLSYWYIERVDDIDLTLNGPINGQYYATLCLPFTVTISGADAYTLTLNASKDGLTLSEAMTEIPAGTPVLLRGSSATATAAIAADAAYVSAPLTSTSLTGTFVDKAVTAETDYFLGTDGTNVGFYKWNGTTLKANRAYLAADALSANVKGVALNFDAETGIEEIVNGKLSNSKWYNLAGQRVHKPVRGLYIVDGKKVVIR